MPCLQKYTLQIFLTFLVAAPSLFKIMLDSSTFRAYGLANVFLSGNEIIGFPKNIIVGEGLVFKFGVNARFVTFVLPQTQNDGNSRAFP